MQCEMLPSRHARRSVRELNPVMVEACLMLCHAICPLSRLSIGPDGPHRLPRKAENEI
jgi:hypothetical protein